MSFDNRSRGSWKDLTRGGMEGLGNEDIDELQESIDTVRHARGLPISSENITYLQEYVKIQESFLDQSINTSAARTKIDELNEKYARLDKSVLRTQVLGVDIMNAYDEAVDWLPSSWGDC